MAQALAIWGNVILSIIEVFRSIWWVFFFLLLFFIVTQMWLLYRQSQFIKSIQWVTLEVKVPRENLKSPKSMEQVFASLHATYSFGILFWDKWWKGRVEEWMAVEMVGFAQGVHFYVRIPEKYRNLVETALFSQYPDVEIYEAEEYTDRFGTDLPNDQYDLFGTDFILSKENPYPIRTYPSFEEQVEERRVDPMATIAEVTSNLKDDEMIWLQILIRPTGDSWKEEAEDIINKITGRKKEVKLGPIGWIFNTLFMFFKNLLFGPVYYPTWGEKKEEEKKAGEIPKRLTPGEMDILKAVENKISKIGFETILRFIYIDSKASFTPANVSAVMGALRQFNTLNLNAFKPALNTMTIPAFPVPWFRRGTRVRKRKKNLFQRYLTHLFPEPPPLGVKLPFLNLGVKTPVLNIEELATIFHPPITYVGAPKLWRLEVRKGEPPANLPIQE